MTRFTLLLFILSAFLKSSLAQKPIEASAVIDVDQLAQPISPLIFGQFIEYLGRCIDGGIYDANSGLSDENGFRKDVLEKVNELQVPLMRFPGGTVIKTYHWQDGIGPKNERPKKKNLIWGGINDNQFGTAEFVAYCRKIGAEPFLVINMATGTPEEAASWVEYCNGTDDSYWANLRRKHGYEKPFNVKYWGIGNEEYAATDVGKDQNVVKYIEDAWMFVKMMKLQDPGIKLTLVGNSTYLSWSRLVLKEMHPVCDFLSVHLYSIPADSKFTSLLGSIEAFNNDFNSMRLLLQEIPVKVQDFSSWYRFSPRSEPVKLAVDEWGIWDINSGKGRGDYQMEYTYNWSHALAVGKFLNLFQRNADIIGLATWAQTVNVLAPIMSSKDASFKQTVFTTLKAYRENTLANNLPVKIDSPQLNETLKAVEVAASISDDKSEISVAVLNFSNREMPFSLALNNLPPARKIEFKGTTSFSAPSLESANDFGKDCVSVSKVSEIERKGNQFTEKLLPLSLNFFRFKLF
jgi:alpha-N-arabinofuranosidase